MRLDIPGPFVDDADIPVGATMVNQFLKAAVKLDGLSYRSSPAFDSAADLGTGAPGFYPDTASFRCWWGTILYRPGMTTLTIPGLMDKRGGAYMAFYVNGVLKDTQTANGAFSKSIALDTASLSDGAAIAIEVRVQGNSQTGGTYLISDAYANAPSVATAYPGKAIFTDFYPSAQFVRMAGGLQHLVERMAAVPRVAQIGHFSALGGMGRLEVRPLYTGFPTRNFTSDILRVAGRAEIKNAAERMHVAINGTRVYSTDPWPPGTYPFYLAFSLTGTAVGAQARVDLSCEVVSSGPRDTWDFSRYTFDYIGTQPDMYGYPVPTIPAPLDPLASYTQAQLTAALNQIATVIDDTKTRMDATPLWARVRAMRRMYCQRDDQTDQYHRFAPRLVRLGDQLTVRGKNLTLGWGPIIPESPYTKAYNYSFTNSQQVTEDSDAIETKLIYLDECKGLLVGQPYALLGEVHYVAEV